MSRRQRVLFVSLLMLAVFLHGFQWVHARRSFRQWQHVQELGPPYVAEETEAVPVGKGLEPVDELQEEGDSEKESQEDGINCCDKIHINYAPPKLLETLPGIGPVYAENIVLEREKQLFMFAEELLRVRGIGPARLEAIQPLICLYIKDDTP